MQKLKICFLFLIFAALCVFLVSYLPYALNISHASPRLSLKETTPNPYGPIDEWLDFEGFNNKNGTDKLIVPDIVHLLYLQHTEIKFYEMINIFSIYLNHKPSLIYLHCDNCSFHGKYWHQIKRHTELFKIIRINSIPFHSTIFGIEYGWVNHHRSDVWRLLVLMNYGGIYFDNDVYVVKPLHEFRKYEMTVSWDSDKDAVGVQVLVAHKNARLLKAHFDAYR